ncbi:MAG: RNA polymerase sigma factor [bacterium]|nr:RNA polymerase sigma factor [bacterium]
MTKKQEHALIQQIMAKDERSLHKLYHSYHDMVHDFIAKRISQTPIVEEVTQDVFISVLERLRDFRFQCSIKTFIYTIARNKVVDYYRKKKIKNILFSRLPSFVVESLSPVFMEDEIEKKELQQKLINTFAKLPHDYELVLRLKYIEEQSVKDIAAKLTKTCKSTESLIYRARQAFIQVFSVSS